MTDHIKNLARDLLAAHECDETTYTGMPVDLILGDLNLTYPDGYKGISNKEMAEAIYAISTTDRGWEKKEEYRVEGYGAKWGLTDLYDDVRQNLESLVDSGKPFWAGYVMPSKDLGAWWMERELTNGSIMVHAAREMDEGGDLVYDALPEGAVLDYDDVDEILTMFYECDGVCSVEDSVEVPGNSKLEDILIHVDAMADLLDCRLKESFETMKGIVADYVNGEATE